MAQPVFNSFYMNHQDFDPLTLQEVCVGSLTRGNRAMKRQQSITAADLSGVMSLCAFPHVFIIFRVNQAASKETLMKNSSLAHLLHMCVTSL